jgi:putative glutamine amidotransferase
MPLIVPIVGDVAPYLDLARGVVVSGSGADVPPEEYGEAPREGLGPLRPERTAFERRLMEGALARDLPVLGVCGGMQLLYVVLGGKLYQDLPREHRGAPVHRQPEDPAEPWHEVQVAAGSQLSRAVGGAVSLRVNSTHHQAPRLPAPAGVRVCAVAPDGVVEGIESERHRFALGVQWHPEALREGGAAGLGVYRALVEAARG